LIWGGDMIVHAIRRTVDGQIAVALPESIAVRFTKLRTKLSPDNLFIGELTRPTLISLTASRARDARISFDFHKSTKVAAQLMIDAASGHAQFGLGRSYQPIDIDFPRTVDGNYKFDLLVEPELGLAVLYINHFRALSFRYYRVGQTKSSIAVHSGSPQIIGTVSNYEK
jgi:hypothetical protein